MKKLIVFTRDDSQKHIIDAERIERADAMIFAYTEENQIAGIFDFAAIDYIYLSNQNERRENEYGGKKSH